jgi:SAM-dependent methyltransferase
MEPSPQGRALRADYDADPARFAANQAATAAYSDAGDVHTPVARELARRGVPAVLDLAGGTGTLARALAREAVHAVVVDAAAHIGQAPRPAVRADLRALPFRDAAFPAAACLWALYHLDEPRRALREAARVLEPGGWFVACTSARTNDPELCAVLPAWGAPGTFDAEDAADIVHTEFDVVEVEHWDAPMIRLPDERALVLFLRGRGLSDDGARRAAARLTTPLQVTKRGCLVWGRRRPSGARR